jgi:hypothetical protein
VAFQNNSHDINYWGSKQESATLSLWVSLCRGTIYVRQRSKKMMVTDGALMAWCSVYGRSKIETRLSDEESTQGWYDLFYNSGGWESVGLRRIAYGGGADSMLHFWLERESDETKHCQKMKWRQRARLGLMWRKWDTSWQCDYIGQRRGDTGKGKRRRRPQLDWCKFYWTEK